MSLSLTTSFDDRRVSLCIYCCYLIATVSILHSRNIIICFCYILLRVAFDDRRVSLCLLLLSNSNSIHLHSRLSLFAAATTVCVASIPVLFCRRRPRHVMSCPVLSCHNNLPKKKRNLFNVCMVFNCQ